MFWIVTTGFSIIWIPWLLNSLTTFSTALRDSFSDLAPVHTILPVPKIRVAVFGFFRRKTKPGKTLGLYSVWGNFSTIFWRSIFWFKETEATIFWMRINGFPLLICYSHVRITFIYKGVYKWVYKRFCEVLVT